MNERRKPEYLEKTADDELQKMPHTKPINSIPNQNLNLHSSIGGRLGMQIYMLTITQHVTHTLDYLMHTCLSQNTSVSTPNSLCLYFQILDQIFLFFFYCRLWLHHQSSKTKKCHRQFFYHSSIHVITG